MIRKWTPGPWFLDGGSVTSDALHEMDCIVDHVYGPEHNAYLIAAAPELYEALEYFTSMCQLSDDADWKEGDDPISVACAALAKARGEK